MPDKSKEEIEREEKARERREYIARMMNPATYGITGRLTTPEAFNDAIGRLRDRGVNILGPSPYIDHIPRHYVMSLRWAFFDQDFPVMTGKPGKMGNGTWYQQTGGGLSPAWGGMLSKLVGLTGLRIVACERSDDRRTEFLWSYRVVGELRYFDGGDPRPDMVDVPYDLRDGSGEAKAAGDQLWKMRAKGAQRAETFAKSRLVRHMLGLDQKYTEAAADMPFVWPMRIYEAPADPELDRFLALKEMGLLGDLYGAPKRQIIDIAPAPAALPDHGTAMHRDFRAEADRLGNRAGARSEPEDDGVPWDRDEEPGPPVEPPPTRKPEPPAPPPKWRGTAYVLDDVVAYCEAKHWPDPRQTNDGDAARLAAWLNGQGRKDIDGFLGAGR